MIVLTTRFTQLVGCSVPIQQAAIGGLANPTLAAAVSNAGGLGMTALAGGSPDEITAALEKIRSLTRAPFGANFVPPLMDPATLRECVAAAAPRARVVEFFYATPDPSLVALVHEKGALVSWQVGSREEAVAAAEAGCDLIVAQGVEAGGHVRGKIGLLPLLGEVLGAVRVPVLAAGGIGSGRAMAAALAAGADGVRVGTRFVASVEAGAHPEYVEALFRATAEDTVLTETFGANWPNAPHRVLRSSVEAVLACKDDVIAEGVDEESGETFQVRRLYSVSPRKSMRGNIAALPHWAGESVAAVKRLQPAAEIVRELMEEAEASIISRQVSAPAPA